MPEMNGITATQRLREAYPSDEQPIIIALTADVMGQEEDACLLAGMDGFVSKPIRMPELITALQRGAPAH